MENTFCGKTWDEMNRILDVMCELEDKYENLTNEEEEAFDIAIQCIAKIMNGIRVKPD